MIEVMHSKVRVSEHEKARFGVDRASSRGALRVLDQ